jgi:hypothetical protein
MDPLNYYRSLAAELDALKDRVRYLIQDGHWPTDGEWKESVLRTVFRGHLPANIGVGRGFIVSEANASPQIDVLLFDKSRPLLHRDGDLVFVTPDAVRGIVEVKSTLRTAQLVETASRLGRAAGLVQGGGKRIFLGLFAFEAELGEASAETLLRGLQQAAGGNEDAAVNHVCAGWSLFVRYWRKRPTTDETIRAWYSYSMPNLAPGYFVANALETIAGASVTRNLWAWFPADGKEMYKSGERQLQLDALSP